MRLVSDLKDIRNAFSGEISLLLQFMRRSELTLKRGAAKRHNVGDFDKKDVVEIARFIAFLQSAVEGNPGKLRTFTVKSARVGDFLLNGVESIKETKMTCPTDGGRGNR
ncbi:MAG: hypothetical protein ABFE13_11825 [Phycisphaerales bacterium]